MKYDAVIAGASFAGLAVARALKGNILLIDRKKEIGDGQTSTCCAHESFIRKIGCQDAILQKIDTLTIHVGSEDFINPLKEPLATVDYKKFCRLLFKNSRAQFLSAKVLGLEGNKVLTDKGDFYSDCIVDATGWQAVLASQIKKDFVKENDRSFGIETMPAHQNKAIEIWVNPKTMQRGVTWIFPCGSFSRVGIASYKGKTNIKEGLENFIKNLNLAMIGELHGGFFPHAFREPTVENIFLVGDSAGQCLPLTGEGIRPAIYFGDRCGRVIQQIIEGKKTLKEGQKEYREFVFYRKKYYTALSILEKLIITLPSIFAVYFAKFVNSKLNYFEKKYVNLV